MKKELSQSDLSAISELKIINKSISANNTAAHVHVSNEFAEIIDFRSIVTPFSTLPLDNRLNRFIKRSLDILLSLLVIVLFLSWLIPLLVILIKINSGGPAFFLQKRNKRNGELFTCIKFRSMYINADADVLPALKNDNRVTSIGRFLRKHHLDELPQFFNVLCGDMAIVGPRPHMVSDNIKFDELIKNYAYRHKVKPGITGLAQMLGYHGHVDDLEKMKARVNMDIFYARHWSPKLDMIILYRTICKTLGI